MNLLISLYKLITDIDECDSDPCEHGSCTDQVDGYSCSCDAGYAGSNCDIGK